MAHELTLRSISYERQKALPLVYKAVKLDCGYRAYVIVGGRVVVELKAVESLAPIHEAVVLTYLRMSGCKIGLLINFNVPVLKDGIKRLVLDYKG